MSDESIGPLVNRRGKLDCRVPGCITGNCNMCVAFKKNDPEVLAWLAAGRPYGTHEPMWASKCYKYAPKRVKCRDCGGARKPGDP